MDMLLEIQLILTNKFGVFKGRTFQLNQEEYDQLLKMSKKFYSAGGFELTLEDGSFMVFPPDIVLESILTITKKLITVENTEQKEEDVQE